jgi:sterol desaturase/sphingolipid hydroxylase (fatty acid hydroxylase superfamily)
MLPLGGWTNVRMARDAPGAAKYLNASYDQKRYGVTSVQTAAPPPSSVLHAAISRTPVTVMENGVARHAGKVYRRPFIAYPFFGGILILDLVRYAGHFAFHAITPLWRVHAIHHSDVDFDITTGLRHHPLEVLPMAGAEFAAITLFGIPASAVFVLACIVIAHALFSHANASLPPAVERILRLVIVAPQFHEVHHAIDLREQKANRGNVFPWWDRFVWNSN